MDFDNDGLKDLFISNGIPKRLNDIDYINFISNQELQNQMRNGGLDDKDMDLVNKFPEIKLPSKFFRNTGEMRFSDLSESIGSSRPTYSNGAVYADLDGDGDLDIVVNNIDDAALIYRNNTNDGKKTPYVDIRLKGPEKNSNALGAKLLTLKYVPGLPSFDYRQVTQKSKNTTVPIKDITSTTGLVHKHEENDFHEFDREPLLPHMLSTEGPALAIGDMNKDGLEDVFIGSSKWKKSSVFLQQPGGKFIRSYQPALDADSTYEDVDACWMDVNNDGNKDLVVAGGW